MLLSTLTIVALAGIAAGSLLVSIAPQTRPVVTVYMQPGCVPCARWMEHLAARGFQTQLGDARAWPSVRASFGISPELHSSHTAIVDGLFVEGPVPARDLHLALQWRKPFHLRGVIVPGQPRGSPGNEAGLPERYTVLVMRDGGRVHEFEEHNHWW